jgi:hypothetical protein
MDRGGCIGRGRKNGWIKIESGRVSWYNDQKFLISIMLSSLAQNRKGASLKSDGTEENIPNI